MNGLNLRVEVIEKDGLDFSTTEQAWPEVPFIEMGEILLLEWRLEDKITSKHFKCTTL